MRDYKQGEWCDGCQDHYDEQSGHSDSCIKRDIADCDREIQAELNRLRAEVAQLELDGRKCPNCWGKCSLGHHCQCVTTEFARLRAENARLRAGVESLKDAVLREHWIAASMFAAYFHRRNPASPLALAHISVVKRCLDILAARRVAVDARLREARERQNR